MSLSLPNGFINQLEGLPGFEREAFLKSLQQEPLRSVRINPHKIKLNSKSDRIPWCESALPIEYSASLGLDPWWHGGAYYAQEPSSMFVGFLAEKLHEGRNHARVLDLCAAPGGKSTHLAALLGHDGTLVANEVISSRNKILRENLTRWGIPNFIITQVDTHAWAKSQTQFDIVVVDAPCSGEGLFRKDPASTQEWSIDQTKVCAERQEDILENAWECAAPGGFIIYCTCTYNRLENEDIIERFTEKYQVGATPQIDVPHDGIICDKINDAPTYRFWPHHTPGEGFFAAVIRKPEDNRVSKSRGRKIATINPNKSPAWLSDDAFYHEHNNTVYQLTQPAGSLLKIIPENVAIRQAGQPVAELKGEKWKPHAGLAFSTLLQTDAFQKVEFSVETAVDFLARLPLDIPVEGNSIRLVTHRDLPLGFLKKAGNRWNNLYPMNWRIRDSESRKPVFVLSGKNPAVVSGE